MPTVLRVGAYRFHFYEGQEPPHIHVRTPEGECKFWLGTVLLAGSRGVRASELRRIERLVHEHRQFLIDKYHEFHSAH